MSKHICPKQLFYLLSWTWGIIMTLIGNVAAICLIIAGYKPKKNCYGWYFEVGENWGGVDLGYICIVQHNSSQYLRDHEFGHSVQNIFFGPLFPFLVAIPSAVRYQARTFIENRGWICKTGYFDIWFEKQASECGTAYREHIEKGMR